MLELWAVRANLTLCREDQNSAGVELSRSENILELSIVKLLAWKKLVNEVILSTAEEQSRDAPKQVQP